METMPRIFVQLKLDYIGHLIKILKKILKLEQVKDSLLDLMLNNKLLRSEGQSLRI